MILRPQLEPTDHQSVLDYYLDNYQEVHIVKCEKCGNDLAVEVKGDVSGYKMNEKGFVVLPFGGHLLGSRVRLDETTDGDRLMGYQCGFTQPNPDFEPAMKAWQAECEKIMKKHEAIVAKEQKAFNDKLKKTWKPGQEIPQFVSSSTLDLPERPDIEPVTYCGNDTILADVEKESVEVRYGAQETFELPPYEKHVIRQELRRKVLSGEYKPKFKKVGAKEHHETFTRERIK